ncbi:hypothetical protein [Agrobacterium sp. V1]|uniref:hypothetical protein n=1 Tax=Agrobacterium sp. V1 TaxID=3061957 RepID=UPI002670E9FB|nr:hypothetical protein [Agrobacterium sp. V1]MDO3442069.1 hypothetical protein [Agrobacterium sp. V1]
MVNESWLAKNHRWISVTGIAGILFIFALAVRFSIPYAEWNLDANNILRAVIYSDLHGVQAGGVSMRYWYQDNLYQWWLGAFLPVKELASPVTATSLMQLLSVASLLPKILGALNIALIFCFSVSLGADRTASIIVSATYAITAQHVVLSSIVERQVLSQTFLIVSFLIASLASKDLGTRYMAYGLAIALNIFGVICYSPPVMFFPFLMLFILSLELEKHTASRDRIGAVLAILGLALSIDSLLYFMTGASILSVMIGSMKFFVMYADPGSQDEFSKIDEGLVIANITWLFGHLFQWLPYYRTDNFAEISVWAAILSCVVVMYCFYCAITAILPYKKHLDPGLFEFLGTSGARLGILSAAFLIGIALNLVVRHGNQTEFYIMPYTFILPVVAERFSRHRSESNVGLAVLCGISLLVALTVNGNPFIGASFQDRNSYIGQNASAILPTMTSRP